MDQVNFAVLKQTGQRFEGLNVFGSIISRESTYKWLNINVCIYFNTDKMTHFNFKYLLMVFFCFEKPITYW